MNNFCLFEQKIIQERSAIALLDMETLRNIRPDETIYMYTKRVEDKKHDIVDILKTRIIEKVNIMIITNHSPEIVDIVLKSILPHESGFFFMQSEIDIDPINNPMVPLHRLATSEELMWLKEKKIPNKCLPVLLMRDPIRRWHNFPLNTIVTIERPGSRPYFRRVIT